MLIIDLITLITIKLEQINYLFTWKNPLSMTYYHLNTGIW